MSVIGVYDTLKNKPCKMRGENILFFYPLERTNVRQLAWTSVRAQTGQNAQKPQFF